MGISMRAYARLRGVAHSAVQKAIRSGRITREPDGSIDPKRADAEWAANTRPASVSTDSIVVSPSSAAMDRAMAANVAVMADTLRHAQAQALKVLDAVRAGRRDVAAATGSDLCRKLADANTLCATITVLLRDPRIRAAEETTRHQAMTTGD